MMLFGFAGIAAIVGLITLAQAYIFTGMLVH